MLTTMSTTLINNSDTDTICYSDSDDEPYFYEDTGSESDESDRHAQVSFWFLLQA